MHKLPTPPKMQDFLKTFENATDIRFEYFVAGIRQFTEFANLDFDARQRHFGNGYLGLHYNNDLSKEWNESHSESVKSLQLNSLCPLEWDYVFESGFNAFLYKGKMPAEALDSFVKGPSVIDCGMFTQLGIWFGIRNMLGNEKFNQLFGNAPFYITQINYNQVTDPKKPYLSNPLYPFFSDSKSDTAQVSVCHLKNNSFYQMKHPGGNDGGQNCIEVGGYYTIFDPSLERTQGISKQDVQALLVTAFNQAPDTNDAAKLDAYKEANPENIHPKLRIPYGKLITMATTFKDIEIEASECGDKVASLYFDLEKFKRWVEAMSHDLLTDVTYLPEETPSPSETILAKIPFENRATMNFAYFEANIKTPQQAKLLNIAKKNSVRM